MFKTLKIIFLILSFLSFLLFIQPRVAYGIEVTNKYGIHILEPSDLEKAAELVNSSGGDWGYVTIVIRDDDLNFDKWQNFMDQCREKHLIPLVRIATHLEGENWAKPKLLDAEKWANFLNSLNWPVKDQYVILFNEPNHAKEWGGEINPKEYARILSEFNLKFKISNFKFKVLNAGLDLAAGNTKSTMDAYKFWQEMNWEIPGIFERLDGWASHSYPNHGYLGKPWDQGKTSIRGYDWELTVLKNNFGLKKSLPVFITETGWPANNLKFKISNLKLSRYYDRSTVANYIKYALENVWLKDNRIKAITPFLLNYPEPLFSDFAWLDKSGNPYPQFETIKSITKINWWPEQVNKFSLGKIDLPPFLLTESSYEGQVNINNEGQSILGERNDFLLKLSKSDKEINVSDLTLSERNTVKPFEKATLEFEIKTGTESGEFNFSWEGAGDYKINVLKPTFITKARLSIWQKILSKIKLFRL